MGPVEEGFREEALFIALKESPHGPTFRQRHRERRAVSGEGAALFLFHSLLSDRASFDAIVPKLSQAFQVIVPELPGFGGSKAVSGGLAATSPTGWRKR